MPDWESIFWRVQRFWGHDSRFDADNFGYQPIWLVLQALNHGAKLQTEELHLQELGIATLTACYINSNRDPKSAAVKPKDFCYFASEAKNPVPSPVCDAFFSLAADQKLEPWILAIAPIEQLRSNRANGAISYPRALIGQGVFLVLPVIEGRFVRAEFACLEKASGVTAIADPDSGNQIWIRIPKQPGARLWALDVSYEILGNTPG